MKQSKKGYYLSPEQKDEAIRRWLASRHPASGDKLALSYRRLAYKIANRYAFRYGYNANNLSAIAISAIGFAMLDYQQEDYDAGKKLSTFVFKKINWELMRWSAREHQRIKLPFGNIASRIRKAIRELDLMDPLTEASIDKLAAHLNENPVKIRDIYLALKTRDTTYHTPLRSGSLEVEASLEDKLESEWPSPEDFANRDIIRKKLTRMMLTLLPREERVLRLRFGINCNEHTLDEVGELFGVSQERIRSIESKALRKLTHPSRLKRLMPRGKNRHTYSDHFNSVAEGLPYQ